MDVFLKAEKSPRSAKVLAKKVETFHIDPRQKEVIKKTNDLYNRIVFVETEGFDYEEKLQIFENLVLSLGIHVRTGKSLRKRKK